MADLSDDQIIEQVELEFRPGGRPFAVYLALGVNVRSMLLGSVLTTRTLLSFEERLVAIEAALAQAYDDARGDGSGG